MDTPTVLPGATRQYLARYYDRLDRVEEDFARTRLSDSLSCNAARQMALVLRAAADLARWLPGGLVSPSLISLAATIAEGAGSYAARLDASESADTAGSANEEDLRLSQVWVRHVLARTLVGMRARRRCRSHRASVSYGCPQPPTRAGAFSTDAVFHSASRSPKSRLLS